MDRILVVEDDKTIAMGIAYSLKQEGFETRICHTVHEASACLEENFDLFLLDVALPDGDGFELCRLIRKKGEKPVIFLTARDDEVNIVMGLDMGADDYVAKPFRVRELISRIKSVLRRYQNHQGKSAEITLGPLTIYTTEARVTKGGEEIILTTLEYKLLLTLAGHQGQVLSRNQMLEGIWDVAGDFVNDNTLTVYIKRLREKIEDDPQNPKLIKTVRGMGYKADGDRKEDTHADSQS
ncbi:DNA-binding response regulator [Xylanibacillus composti]|uniref:DNA-binding response regulator n=1 Tax=Xylanibacillus composti TaxID=1572762 RepID=A0A8J4H0K4_9BACL|nr:response regulator transcription factor [Xylanibacillus composti]MDT9726820.1 DNA-binding response regulator [Xylanibacillus composti]GIQ67196.1 DNA-binding response regulator [Xylanibacillus composti]